MKAILYFVAAGIVLPRHTDAAEVIAKKTGKRVVFRNADTGQTEKPEANEGVAGKVPENYKAFAIFGDTGAKKGDGNADASNRDPGKPKSDSTSSTTTEPGTTERKFNALGVVDEEGAPADRDALKGILTQEGIEFHGNAKTEALVDLYNAHFYPEG